MINGLYAEVAIEFLAVPVPVVFWWVTAILACLKQQIKTASKTKKLHQTEILGEQTLEIEGPTPCSMLVTRCTHQSTGVGTQDSGRLPTLMERLERLSKFSGAMSNPSSAKDQRTQVPHLVPIRMKFGNHCSAKLSCSCRQQKKAG